ncbi:MAG: MraY family glycosyltransferase [Armatimonadetes bacterium]|nr:MraY family glycosyltransferase [Armatimonadota bacterium]
MNLPMIAFVMALAISFLVTPWVRRLALRLNVMVHPGGRRVHTQPMPLWGGMAIFAAFTITCLVIMRFDKAYADFTDLIVGVIVSGAIIFTVGLLDDMKEFSAALQAAAIVIAGIILSACFHVSIKFVSNPFGGPAVIVIGSFVSYLVTIMWVFAMTKTVDFMDGLDGLAAGIGAIGAGILAIMAYYSVQPHVALMAAALSGACIGFLRFNFNPAKIFMGTGGSQFIGFVLAAISIIGLFKVAAAMAIALPILVFGVPIADGVFVILKRFRDGRPIHMADKTHLHHRLLEKGLSHKQAVIAIYGMCLVLGGTALVLLWSWMRGFAAK